MTADEARAERLHPLALLTGFGRAARNLFGGFAAGGYFAFQGRGELAVLILGGIVVVTLVGLLLKWWSFSYRVGSDAIRIDTGILHRNHRTVPFDRVADVSIAQGPLQRLVGVARVTLETGSSTVGQEEGELTAVSLGRAEALRDQVRARRSAALPVSGEEGEPPALFAMGFRRLLTLGLFNFSLALLAGLFGASQTVGGVIGIDPFERDFWRPILVQSGWGEWLLDHRLALAGGGLAVLVAAGIATGLIRTILREYGFRLDRSGGGLRRRRGLLTRTDVTLPVRRMQAGIIATGPIRDRYGWRAFRVQSLASDQSDGGGGGDHVLAPLADDQEVARVAGELGWRLPAEDASWQPVSKAHVWIYCIVLLPVFPLLILLGPLRWLDWRRTAWAIDGEWLWLRTGWWRRKTLILPVRNVQTVDIAQTSLARRFGVATLAVGTAGGRFSGHRIPALPTNQASLLRRELLRFQP